MRVTAASRTLAYAVLVCALAATDSRGEPGSALTLRFHTAHFTVQADPADPYLARLTAQGAEDHLRRVSRSLGLTLDPTRPFTLRVYRTHMDFIRAGGLHTRKFTVGTAASDDTVSVDASGSFEPTDRILAHEITHAVVFRILGPRAPELPLWFNEGLAKLESEGSDKIDRDIVGDAAAGDRLIPLRRLRDSFPEDRSALAYAQSYLAVKELSERYGEPVPRRVLHAMAKGESFDKAMLRAAGISGAGFEEHWHRLTTERYRASRAARAAAAFISFTMAALAVAAFLARRKQKIEAARRWEQEEMDSAVRRLLGDDRHG